MSGKGAPEGSSYRRGQDIAIVAGRWHGEIVDALLAGARAAAVEAGASVHVERAPGAFEIPVVAEALARTGRYDAIVALGVVMRGGTPHFDYVCHAVTEGCLRVSLAHRMPVGFGVLTVDDEEQARARLDKGREAVLAALETSSVIDRIR